MTKVPPNIVVFMDDQEQGQVCLPNHPCIKPTVSKMIGEGLLFPRAYTPTAHSCPARASYFTGTYPSQNGVYNNVLNPPKIHGSYDPSLTHFSEVLRKAGYNLGLTGKWHVSDTENPADRGWDEIYPRATREVYMGVSWEKWRELAQEKMDDSPRKRGEIIMPGYGRRPMYRTDDVAPEDHPDYRNDLMTVTKAIEAMKRYAKEGKPFCIHCGPGGPHDPYLVPKKYVDMYDLASVPLPQSFHDTLEDKPRIYQRQRQQNWSQLTPDEVRESILHYWAYCTMMDDLFKMLYDAIDDLGLRENTLLVYTSDHGDYCGAHGMYCKGVASFDEGYRIPLVVRWPEGIERPGRVVDEFVTLCDFPQTFLEAAGQPLLKAPGRSFAGFFKRDAVEDWPQEFHSQMNGVELYYTQRISMTKDYKYVFNGFDFDELYDLRKDPFEIVNLNNDPDYQDVKFDLVKRMWRFAESVKDTIAINYWTCALVPWGPRSGLAETGSSG